MLTQLLTMTTTHKFPPQARGGRIKLNLLSATPPGNHSISGGLETLRTTHKIHKQSIENQRKYEGGESKLGKYIFGGKGWFGGIKHVYGRGGSKKIKKFRIGKRWRGNGRGPYPLILPNLFP